MRSASLMLATALSIFTAPSSASAQDIGQTTVTGLTGLCDAFLNLTPFYDAAAGPDLFRSPARTIFIMGLRKR